jgi:hypothetical protein
MRHALLLVCGLALVATAAPVPQGTGAAKPKSPEEAEKAARYKALREGYEALRDSLPKKSLDRALLELDLTEARHFAAQRVHAERVTKETVRTAMLEGWERSVKPLITDTPRRKELYEIFYYELSQTR